MKNQKGFAAVETIIVFLAIVIIAGAGWYVWHSKHTEKPAADSTAAQHAPSDANTFTGKVDFDQCVISHSADGGCSIVVNNKSVQIVQGNVAYPDGWGNLIGFEALQDIKGHQVQVYANQIGPNTYDLAGSQYYVKLLN